MQLVDIGANLTHVGFRDDLEAVVAHARGAGVATLIVTGTTVLESRLAAEIADRFDLYCTAGVHPHHARDCNDSTIAELRHLAVHPRCVAIGDSFLWLSEENTQFHAAYAMVKPLLILLESLRALKLAMWNLHSGDAQVEAVFWKNAAELYNLT